VAVSASEGDPFSGRGRGSARSQWFAWSIALCSSLVAVLAASAWVAASRELRDASDRVAKIGQLGSEVLESSDVLQANLGLRVLAKLDARDPEAASDLVQRSLRRLQARLQRSEDADARRIAREIDDRLAGRAVAVEPPFLPYYQHGRLVGLRVSALEAGDRLATAGLVVGDVITQVERTRVGSPTTAREAVDAIASRNAVELVVLDRSGVERPVRLPGSTRRPLSP
jgi:C-terminal processing protease CtpA/Prc